MATVISVEHLSKAYQLGQIGTGTLTNDLRMWWARKRGLPNPLQRVGDVDRGNGDGETLWALKDVSLNVEQGEVVGIIGRNGAGKSTLLKVLSRITAPTSGTVKVKGRIASLLEVGTGFHPELTGRENIYLNGAILGMSKKEIARKFDEILDFAEIEKFIETPVKRYSSGMYVRLAFAVAAHLEPEILLVDEVLAVGDAEFQRKCLGKMGQVAHQGRTVLFVSHNMEAILNLCPQTQIIAHGNLVFSGTSEDAIEVYLGSLSDHSAQLNSHILYDEGQKERSGRVRVTRMETLDSALDQKPLIRTWDEVVFRVHYSSDCTYTRGTFILDVFDRKQQRLVVCDSGTRLPILEGDHHVDCRISRFPLASGEFYLGAGLAVSNSGWLWREKNLCAIRVHARDAFDLGRPPDSNRMLFAVEHTWQS